MQNIDKQVVISSQSFLETQKKSKNIPGFKSELENGLAKDITRLVEIILSGGVALSASDVHIEPEKKQARVRARVDGVLQDVIIIDLKTYNSILSRLKLLSGLKFNVADRPQDGRFSVLISESPVEVRVSTLPAEYGESVVLRILNPKGLIELEALGLRKDLLENLKKGVGRPNGMIIVTGPTGSGKTTTLYAILKKIQKPDIKIITIEDPIEYHLQGISQTQVNPAKGYNFASGLKSIMRQDPDMILVGEIRDIETCEIALQAALTGHLVFTTLHTNDAAGTIARLTNLGAKPVNIGPAINLAIAQRLVRTVCDKCSKLKKPSPEELIKIKEALKGIPQEIKFPKLEPGLKIPQAKGCEHCNLTGYRGRIGIFEMFIVNPEMEKFILTNPSIAALKERAQKEGMITVHQDGIIKVLEGKTTIEEVERVTGE